MLRTMIEGEAPSAERGVRVDPVGRALMCCQRARDCIWAARAAREAGDKDLALAWLHSAEKLRVAASVWRQHVRDGFEATTRAGP